MRSTAERRLSQFLIQNRSVNRRPRLLRHFDDGDPCGDDRLGVVWGLAGSGQPLRESCHSPSIAAKIGCTAQSLNEWVKKAG